MAHDPHCTFCRIMAGELASSRVYEDDVCLAFADIRQRSPGHVLIVPRTHVAHIFDLDDEMAAHLAVVTLRVARAVREVFAPAGIRLAQNNGAAAGQDVFHVHWHVMTYQVTAHGGYAQRPSRAALDEMAALIRQALP